MNSKSCCSLLAAVLLLLALPAAAFGDVLPRHLAGDPLKPQTPYPIHLDRISERCVASVSVDMPEPPDEDANAFERDSLAEATDLFHQVQLGRLKQHGCERRAIRIAVRHSIEAREPKFIDESELRPPKVAPPAVIQVIEAANEIATTPYIWGGGHGSWYDAGYDCSGSVSYALHGAGLLGTPLTSGLLESYGEPGPGKWITIYANAEHVYAVIAGVRWDTRDNPNGTGPRWHEDIPSSAGFVVRHPAGY